MPLRSNYTWSCSYFGKCEQTTSRALYPNIFKTYVHITIICLNMFNFKLPLKRLFFCCTVIQNILFEIRTYAFLFFSSSFENVSHLHMEFDDGQCFVLIVLLNKSFDVSEKQFIRNSLSFIFGQP